MKERSAAPRSTIERSTIEESDTAGDTAPAATGLAVELGEIRTTVEAIAMAASTANEATDLHQAVASLVEIERLLGSVEAAAMPIRVQVDALVRGSGRRLPDARSQVADECRRAKRRIAAAHNQANFILTKVPVLHEALATGEVTRDHVDYLVGVGRRIGMLPFFIEDVEWLTNWARTEDWETFVGYVEAWAIMRCPLDPQTVAERVMEHRGIAVAYGLDGQVMIELDTTTLHWEPLFVEMTKRADRMFTEDWAAAEALLGEETTTSDLVRSNKQRLHDALFEIIRAGLNANADSSVGFEAIIVTDLDTLSIEAARVEANAVASAAGRALANEWRVPERSRPIEEAERRRCETITGKPVPVALAFEAVLAGRLRRVVLDAPDLQISRSARLFRGPVRTAMMTRDRRCVVPGCDVPAWMCEADHTAEAAKGGPTVPSNGATRCRDHHRHKTTLQSLGLWQHQQHP